MKKKIYLLVLLFLVLIPTIKVNAVGTSSISMWSSASTVVVGNYVTFTVDLSSGNGGKFSAWSYTMKCSSNLVYQSGDKVNETAGTASSPLTYKRFTFKYKAKSSGTGSCTFQINSLPDYNDSKFAQMGGTRSKSVSTKIITQAQLEASYSKNNNLSSLSIDGYSLTPNFNKNTLEYSIELPNGTEKIKINASKEDSKASIQGTGERSVSEGANKLEIKVTAQNGSVKTYIINATVKELDPIEIMIDEEKYNVIRKKEQIKSPNSTFVEQVIKINDLDVPAFKNEKLNYTLVGLKDSEGNIKLYIYDSTDNTYTIYQEYKFNSLIINFLSDSTKIPKGYIKSTLNLNNKELIAYKISNDSAYYLLYGQNVETGDKHLYIYDSTEKTIQKYNDDEALAIANENFTQKEHLYQHVIIGLGILLIITYISLLVYLIVSSKKKKKNKRNKH